MNVREITFRDILDWSGDAHKFLERKALMVQYLALSLFFMISMMMYPVIMDHLEVEYTHILKLPQYAMSYLMFYYMYRCVMMIIRR